MVRAAQHESKETERKKERKRALEGWRGSETIPYSAVVAAAVERGSERSSVRRKRAIKF